jgi:two-component system CheB/CheR fusion protein
MSAVLSSLCFGSLLYAGLLVRFDQTPFLLIVLFAGLAILAPAAITYLAASKLTGQINALRKSTEAIAAGDFDSPVDVDCECEVGGLADSFRKMVGRFNSNILRMNVLAFSDGVTGLPNRVVVAHMLEKLAEQDGSAKTAVMFIDLDGFKRINDMLGHEAGDDLLRQASLRIVRDGLDRTLETLDTCTTSLGELCDRAPEDIVLARFAGDEFVALLPGVTDVEALEEYARKILAALRRPFDIRGSEVTIGGSIGIARAPDDTANAVDLVNFADLAMYVAKQGGKNRFAFFDPSLRDIAVEKNILESELRHGMDAGELTLHFQPKLDSHSLHCVGLEALARWNHPSRGMVPPGTFIPIAEQAGMMQALGIKIADLAARQMREWLDQGLRYHVAINVSPVQFESPVFIAQILSVLEKYRIDPALVEIEITESMVMSDFAVATDRMHRLQEAGIGISIDDFGVGFSNLSQIAKIPFDYLKIDQSLVADIGNGAKSEAIVSAIVGMAHALGQKTVAEGIERPQQLRFLREIGCDIVQGYLLGRPMSAEQLKQWELDRSTGNALKMQRELTKQVRNLHA